MLRSEIYAIPRELTDAEWGEISYNVNRKTSNSTPDIPIWVLQETLKYAHFIAGHRVEQIIEDAIEEEG